MTMTDPDVNVAEHVGDEDGVGVDATLTASWLLIGIGTSATVGRPA